MQKTDAAGIPRLCLWSENEVKSNIKTRATAYGGTVNSCALAAEYPSPLIIVGRKPPTEPRPRFIQESTIPVNQRSVVVRIDCKW
jgi:hypothetical protein